MKNTDFETDFSYGFLRALSRNMISMSMYFLFLFSPPLLIASCASKTSKATYDAPTHSIHRNPSISLSIKLNSQEKRRGN